MDKTKPFTISKHSVMRAFELVKANRGAAGVDSETLERFGLNLKDNLYKIWNRMSSGTYFPPAVKAVPISKKSGGERILGVPTVSDRIAQMVVKLEFEPIVEEIFHEDSYGYRPKKSALDAVSITRQRCWKYDFVLEFDIKGLFDNLNHELLMKAVRKHIDNKWVILYIERWLKAPMEMPDGNLQARTKGVPQGGVISPILSNLFLHYAFDTWVSKHYPNVPWCRYADDGLLHCKSQSEANTLLTVIGNRFKECGLELHPDKTKIVYCKDANRKKPYHNIEFKFLGYCFRAWTALNQHTGKLFMSFGPAVCKEAIKAMKQKIRDTHFRKRTEKSLEELANKFNPIINGWINYYGKFHVTRLKTVLKYFNSRLLAWVKEKFKKCNSKTKASIFLQRVYKENPKLFKHWSIENAFV